MMAKSKKDNLINYGKIKRDLIGRDTNFDNRFITKIVETKKSKKLSKKPKHKPNWGSED